MTIMLTRMEKMKKRKNMETSTAVKMVCAPCRRLAITPAFFTAKYLYL